MPAAHEKNQPEGREPTIISKVRRSQVDGILVSQMLSATIEPHSTSRPSRSAMLLASCAPELWIENSVTEGSSAIDYRRQNAFGQYVVQISVVVLAYFIAGKLGQATTSIRSSNLGPVWPAYGIALSSILLYGYRIWIGVAVGAFLVAFLSPVSHLAAVGQAARATIGELAALLMFLIAACFVLFGHLPSIQVKFDVLGFAVLPFVMWAAIKFGTGGASLSVLVTATIATVETAYGQGPFAGNTPFTNAVLLDVFFSVLAVSGLTLSAVIAERDQAARKLTEEKLREYKNAVEGAEEMIAIVDRGYRYVIANRKFLESRNMTRERVIGHLIADVLNPGVFEAVVKEKLDRCFGGEVVRYEMKYTYPELGERDVFISYFPIEGAAGVDRAACIIQDVTERRRAEEAIRESEKRFRLLANTAPVMIWMSGPDKQATYFNQLWLDFTGRSEADLRAGLAGVSHPEDEQRCSEIYIRAFDQRQPFRKECRLRRHDGQYRWMLDIGVPRFHEDGSFAGYIGSCVDVTDRKHAEEALASVNRRLIEAQDQECTRIARELHDDLGQRLALLMIEMDRLSHDLTHPHKCRGRIGELQKLASELATDIQSLSHRLHSSKLDLQGVVAAMKGFCKEFSKQQGVEVDFRSGDLPVPVPRDISLCLYRVLQEALRNSAKHSGVRNYETHLWATQDEIHLTVKDFGKGFDREMAAAGHGLGLVSMRERLTLVGGQLSIQSQPTLGTTIHAWAAFDRATSK